MSGGAHFTLKTPCFPHQMGKNDKDIILNIGKNTGNDTNAMSTALSGPTSAEQSSNIY